MAPFPSVLVADYVAHTARVWVDALARSGYVAHGCTPGDLRPALLQSCRTRLIILAVSHLRHAVEFKDLEGRVIPVLVVTAHPDDVGREREYGCECILLRPVSVANLLQRVRAILGTGGRLERNSSDGSACGRDQLMCSSALRATSDRLRAQAATLRKQAMELCAYSAAIRNRLHAIVQIGEWP